MRTRAKYLLAGAALLAFTALMAWPQATLTAVKGVVTSAGKPVPNAQVVLTHLETGRQYKSKAGNDGSFELVGVIRGDYQVEVLSPTGEPLYKQKRSITGEGGAVEQLALDVSAGGKPGQPKYTKEQIEAIKAQNAKAESMNTLIKQAQDAMAQKNWQAAEQPLQQLMVADPNQYQFYKAYGDTEYNLAKYDAAVDSYEKGIKAAQSTTPDPKKPATDPAKVKAAVSAMLMQEGNSYVKLHKNAEAAAAFKKAAAGSPNPSAAYNLCVVNYNSGNAQEGIPACDQAISADPNNANAYFLKGSLLMQQSKQGKGGKLEAPEGTAEALNKYLQLDPDGPHANDAKQMLQYIGAKIETTYKAKKK